MKRVMVFVLGITLSLCAISTAETMQHEKLLLSNKNYQQQLLNAVESVSILYRGHVIGDFLKAHRFFAGQLESTKSATLNSAMLLDNNLVMSNRQLRPPLAWDLISVLPDARLYSFFTSTDLGGYGENNPPNEPGNPYPADGATDIPVLELTLTWTGGDPDPEDTVVYDLHFWFSDRRDLRVFENITETEFTITDHVDLVPDEYYAWKIVARDNWDAETEGPMWSFTTMHNNPPYEPVNPIPPDGATDVDLNAILTWECNDPDPGDTLTFDVYFGTTNPPPLVAEDISDSAYSPGYMAIDTEYFWMIVAQDNWGAETEGPVWSFRTRANHPPNEPENPNPFDGAVNVDINANLVWDCNDPDPGDTLTFDVYFGETTPPELLASNISESTFDPGAMNFETVYYWKITAHDNWGSTTDGPIWSFTTLPEGVENNPPYEPSNPSPDNGALNVPINLAALTWVGGDPDPGDTVLYDLYFGTSASPPSLARDLTESEYHFSAPLQYTTTYYWKVVARDSYFAATEGPIWTFTTEDPPATPTPFPTSTPTPFPTSPPTFTPTNTPIPTDTPIPTQTPKPTDTPIPTEPPTPTPGDPCLSFSVTLDMGGDYFCAGDTCFLTAKICNPENTQYLPFWVILEVEGMLWFAPSWRSNGIDYDLLLLPEGWSMKQIIPEFTWPNDIQGSYYGVHFYGALTNTRLNTILGDYDMITFGWGPCQ
ncbi:MAG: hypothetical protein WBM02_09125 [bacterium]